MKKNRKRKSQVLYQRQNEDKTFIIGVIFKKKYMEEAFNFKEQIGI